MKKNISISFILASLLTVTPSGLFAFGDSMAALQGVQIVNDVMTTVTDAASQVQQYETLASTLQQQIQTVEQGAKNLDKLSATDFSNYNSYIDQLSQIMAATNGLAYQAADADKKFNSFFPGYDAQKARYANGKPSDKNKSYSDYYKSLTDSNRNTALGTLQTLKQTNQDLQDDATNMNMLKLQSRNAGGNVAVMQAANEIALHQTETLKKLHTSMLSQSNLMAQAAATANEEKVEREAKAAQKRVWTKPTIGDEKNIKPWSKIK